MIIDSLPMPVVSFIWSELDRRFAAHDADFGRVTTKKLTIFGYKLHLLVILNGVILDFVLAPASEADLEAGLNS